MERMERPTPKQRDEDEDKGFSKLEYNNATCSVRNIYLSLVTFAKRNSKDTLPHHVLLM